MGALRALLLKHTLSEAPKGGAALDNNSSHAYSPTMTPAMLVTAHHEAGHAVMAMSCGHKVLSISVESAPFEGRLGRVETMCHSARLTIDWQLEALVCLAGVSSEYLLWQAEGRGEEVVGDAFISSHGRDHPAAIGALRQIGHGDLVQLYMGCAISLLNAPARWQAIRNIASQLISRQQCIKDAAEIARLGANVPVLTDGQLEQLISPRTIQLFRENPERWRMG